MTANLLLKILRYSFHALYHRLAWSYDFVAWVVSFGKWNKWIQVVLQFLEHKEGERVLEIGFGPGQLQFEMTKRGLACFGIDESRQMCKKAAKRLNQLPASHKDARLIRGLSQALPFANNSLAAVVATFPAEYIFDEETLASFSRVLRKGGKLILLMGVKPGGLSLFNRLLRLLYRLANLEFQFQTGPEGFLKRIGSHQFDVRLNLVTHDKDQLWVIDGHKV